MNEGTPGGQSFTLQGELPDSLDLAGASAGKSPQGAELASMGQEAKENRPATSCSCSSPRLSVHVMILECCLGYETIRLGILSTAESQDRQRQRKLFYLASRSLPQCHHQGAFRHSQSKDTSSMLSGPGFPSVGGFQKANLYSPLIPTI